MTNISHNPHWQVAGGKLRRWDNRALYVLGAVRSYWCLNYCVKCPHGISTLMQEKAKDLRPWTPLPVPDSKVLSVVSSFQQPLRVAVRGVRRALQRSHGSFRRISQREYWRRSSRLESSGPLGQSCFLPVGRSASSQSTRAWKWMDKGFGEAGWLH